MAREVFQKKYADFDEAIAVIKSAEDFLANNKYSFAYVKGEHVWRRNDGFLASERIIKAEIDKEGLITISAWVRGILGGEMGVDGFVSLFAKKQLAETLENLKDDEALVVAGSLYLASELRPMLMKFKGNPNV